MLQGAGGGGEERRGEERRGEERGEERETTDMIKCC